MKKIVPFFLSIAIAASCMACCNSTSNTTDNNIYRVEKLTDIEYGKSARNRMDVFLPENRTKETPLFVLIHGGSWVSGDKSFFTPLQDYLLSRGIASVSMNYRFVDSGTDYTDLMDDVKQALDYCKSHSKSWNVNGDNIALGGYSAGGHMALLYGFNYDVNNQVKAVVSWAGPSNLYSSSLLNHAKRIGLLEPMQFLAGAVYTGEPIPEEFKNISPYFYLKNIPVISIHGQRDEIVPYSQAENLHKKLNELAYKNKLISYENTGHSFENIPRETIYQEFYEWIKLLEK